MGNVHEVTQTEPFRSSHGAALLLRDGEKLVEGAFPSYTSLNMASRKIGRSRLSTERFYLVIQTGGKWGYGFELEEFLTANAPVLEDAVFYISDEYAMYVREWRIINGTLSIEFVAPDNSHVGLVLIETAKHRDFGLFLLEDMLDGMLWGGDDKEGRLRRASRDRSVRACTRDRSRREAFARRDRPHACGPEDRSDARARHRPRSVGSLDRRRDEGEGLVLEHGRAGVVTSRRSRARARST
jgi:hypothetical protein